MRADTGVDFVVVMDTDRTRYTHPDPARIGESFIGDTGAAPRGGTLVQEYTGTLGPSMRAVVPVWSAAGGRSPDDVEALVSVGITVDRIDASLRRDLLLVGLVAALVLALGVAGAALVSRRLRRATHGLGEREITRMFEYYSAVLHAVREGLLLLDDRGRVQLVNDEARRLLDLPDDAGGRSVDELGLPPGLVAAARGRRAELDDVYVAGEHVVVVSSSPATWAGRDVGAVVTLRDHTELQAVTGELDVVRGLTDSLRAQAHEAANRLHTVVSLVETGRTEEALDFATEELQLAQLLTDRVVGAVGDPVVAALLLGKSAEAAERGTDLVLDGDLPPGLVDAGGDGRVGGERSALTSRELVTVLGNLVDNALDAVAGRDVRRVSVSLGPGPDGAGLSVVVGDSGPGLPPDAGARVLERGWTTKAGGPARDGAHGIGLALVGQVARRHGGTVSVGRSPLGGAELRVDLPGTGAAR
ncbi:sensor histidine kinase [Nocardioides perillae]|uniref:histidine kinase n=1 Tax=Nocardioides perillae TaxID=1119534 RepID=A0A7Y9RVH4_9ACTN|nr:sensor histidine kinase regulating citrate/malate metabolism [Nocardioides perillae]